MAACEKHDYWYSLEIIAETMLTEHEIAGVEVGSSALFTKVCWRDTRTEIAAINRSTSVTRGGPTSHHLCNMNKTRISVLISGKNHHRVTKSLFDW